MDRTIKVYTLDEVEEKFIDNKELYEFKLWVSIELERILKRSEKQPLLPQSSYLKKQIVKLINKIDNGQNHKI